MVASRDVAFAPMRSRGPTSGARAMILDITGMKLVDAAVARSLTRAASALRLLGADVVLTGVSAGVAQALVGLDVDLGPLMTKATLELGIAYALSCVGQRWVRESEADTAPPGRPGLSRFFPTNRRTDEPTNRRKRGGGPRGLRPRAELRPSPPKAFPMPTAEIAISPCQKMPGAFGGLKKSFEKTEVKCGKRKI
jgi:hypothetical protein